MKQHYPGWAVTRRPRQQIREEIVRRGTKGWEGTLKILITGICGFVGSSLALELRRQIEGLELLGFDNLSRPGSELNRRPLKANGVRLMHGDVRNPSDLESLPKVDWVIDAAANPSVLAGVAGGGARS